VLVGLQVIKRLWVVVAEPLCPVEEADDVVRELAVVVESFDGCFDGVV
jgi:hypothetical protein